MRTRLKDPELQHILLSLIVGTAVLVLTACVVVGQSAVCRAPWFWLALLLTVACVAADCAVCRKR